MPRDPVRGAVEGELPERLYVRLIAAESATANVTPA